MGLISMIEGLKVYG